MSTPAGHALGPRQRYTNGTLTVFVAKCECGATIYGPRVQHIFEFHEGIHLAEVKARSMRNHPSAGGGA